MKREMVLKKELRPKVEEWLEEYGIEATINNEFHLCCVILEEEQDAIAFKLAFGDELAWFQSILDGVLLKGI